MNDQKQYPGATVYYKAKEALDILSLAIDKVSDMQLTAGLDFSALEACTEQADKRGNYLKNLLNDAKALNIKQAQVSKAESTHMAKMNYRQARIIWALKTGLKHLYYGPYASARIDQMAAHLDKEDVEAELESYKEIENSLSMENADLKKQQKELATLLFDQDVTMQQLRERLTEELSRNTALNAEIGHKDAVISRRNTLVVSMHAIIDDLKCRKAKL